MSKAGAEIIAALEEAAAGKFARVTIDGQTWVPETPLHRAAPELLKAAQVAWELLRYQPREVTPETDTARKLLGIAIAKAEDRP
jgi:hypothetical protein